jgi:hypothetical protein
MPDTNSLEAKPLRPHEALAQRLHNGESIPLSDLIAFIEASDKDLTQERKVREKPAPTLDVDFF